MPPSLIDKSDEPTRCSASLSTPPARRSRRRSPRRSQALRQAPRSYSPSPILRARWGRSPGRCRSGGSRAIPVGALGAGWQARFSTSRSCWSGAHARGRRHGPFPLPMSATAPASPKRLPAGACRERTAAPETSTPERNRPSPAKTRAARGRRSRRCGSLIPPEYSPPAPPNEERRRDGAPRLRTSS